MSQRLITSTAFLPPVAWYLAAMQREEWTVEAHENYQKGGYRNRCRIATANGSAWLSIPLEKGKNQGTPIKEVGISYQTDWPRIHQQSIQSAYGRAPFFEFYADEIFGLLHTRPLHLWSLNQAFMELVWRLLQLPNTIQESQYFAPVVEQEGVLDLRHQRARLPLTPPPYQQLFTERHGFLGDLSILDLLFCLGPAAGTYLRANIN
ncbi:MAG: WbqC family protein [Bacteroidota bacterium]